MSKKKAIIVEFTFMTRIIIGEGEENVDVIAKKCYPEILEKVHNELEENLNDWYDDKTMPLNINDFGWTETDSLSANLEGWGLFYSEGSADGLWQIQAIDERGILKDDLEAWEIVREGNLPHHQKVLAFLKAANPKEYDKVMGKVKHISELKPGQWCEDTDGDIWTRPELEPNKWILLTGRDGVETFGKGLLGISPYYFEKPSDCPPVIGFPGSPTKEMY
jgi:hypothetical protein